LICTRVKRAFSMRRSLPPLAPPSNRVKWSSTTTYAFDVRFQFTPAP
jgi:hypothetical protein